MSETPSFQIAKAPYLVAVGDGNRLMVCRSEHVDTQAPAYQEIADYLTDHRMVLIETATITHTNMVGLVHQSHYGTPEARQLWLSRNQESTE